MAPNLLVLGAGNQLSDLSNGEESDAIFYDARTHTDQESDYYETVGTKTIKSKSKPNSKLDQNDALMLISEEEEERKDGQQSEECGTVRTLLGADQA